MGVLSFLSPSSSSSQTTKNFTETVTAGADNGAVTAQNSAVSITDGGAFDVVSKALDKVLGFAGGVVDDVVNSNQQIASQTIARASDAQDKAQSFSETAVMRTTAGNGASVESLGKYAIGGAVVYAAVKAWGNKKK